MPIIIGLGKDFDLKDPLNLFGDKAPGIGVDSPKVETQKPTTPASRPVMDEADRNDLVNTIIAEAGGEGDEGMAGVASVIRNRAIARGKSPADIVREPHQFTGYAKPGPDAQRAMQDPAMRARANTILESVLAGELPDPTGDADHYHAKSVTPDWAGKMRKTATIGAHEFYSSAPSGSKAMPSYDEAMSRQPGITGRSPFDAVLQDDVRKPKGRGMADLLPEEEETTVGSGGALSFAHKGQDQLNPKFRTILEETSSEFGRPFTILSGYRGADHPVESRKQSPGEHSHGTASDISMKGMDDGQRKQLVSSLLAKGVKRFITYTSSPDMLHVDMKDQTGDGSPWFMFDRTNKLLPKAPAWFQEVAANPGAARGGKAEGQPSAALAEGGAVAGRAIVIDENFKPADGLGVFGAAENPFARMAADQTAKVAATKDAVANQFEQTRNNALTERHNNVTAREADRLNTLDGDGWEALTPQEAQAKKAEWEAENRSSGRTGDFLRNWGAGAGRASQGISNLNRLMISQLPGGDYINEKLDAADRWLGGGTTADQKRAQAVAKQEASRTVEGQASAAKTVFDGNTWKLGDALTDPDWYLAQTAQSAPSMVASMGIAGAMSRSAFLLMVGRGAAPEVAAAAAAKTATVAGGVIEGLQGGAETALSIKQQIAAMPRDQLLKSDAAQSLLREGMSYEEVINALSDDIQAQGAVLAGVATGVFGGAGDRMLAKIVGEGLQGSIGRRVATGTARGAVAEGVLEEAPQSAGQQIAENVAMQTVDPNRGTFDGAAEAAASGLAVGGSMGGALGGTAGAARPVSSTSGNENIPNRGTAPVQPDSTGPANTELMPGGSNIPSPQPKGPIRRSVQHADEQIAARTRQTAPAQTDGRPEVGATVRIDADGIKPFMGRVDGYEGDEAVVIDSGSGEIYQIPIGNLTQITKSPEALERENPRDTGPVPIDDGLPEFSSDPALEPQPPIATEVTSEGLPPRKQQRPATERFPTAPEPGQRVIVDDEAGGRFAAKVKSYETGGEEAVVEDDAGNEFQVPVGSLFISNQTEKQIEAEELKRNPPAEREVADAGPNSRKAFGKTVVLPDGDHAALYDLAKARMVAKKAGGASHLDLDRVGAHELARLADVFNVSKTALGAMSEDYRYRVDRAAKEARSTLPVKMHPVNERRLRQWQDERARQEPDSIAKADDLSTWWDVQLTDIDRRRILAETGVKRNERIMWRGMTPAIRAKIETYRAGAVADTPIERLEQAGAAPEPGDGLSVDHAVHQAATSPTNDLPEPTPAQKEAGNYKVGRMRLAGLDLSIENPAGSERKGTDSSGKPWSVKMRSHYGYIRGTVGRDKDHIDAFVRPGTPNLADGAPVFVVDQRSGNGRFDEHKVMIGFDSVEAARAAYLENYTAGWKGLGDITPATMGEFKAWLKAGKTSEPFAPKGEAVDEQEGRSAEWRSRQSVASIHKEMADRVSPTEFVQRASQKEQLAAVIEPGGKLLVLKATSNPDGDHAEFFGRLFEAGLMATPNPYVRITSYGNHIGASTNAPVSEAAAATLQALKTSATREGLTYMDETGSTPPKSSPNMREPTDVPDEQERANSSGAEVREVFRSKEFKKAYADIAATQMGTPHPESAVAREMARGWLDQKGGRPPTHQPVPKGTSDPIEPYYMGYAAARDGKARVIRASDQEAAYRDLVGATLSEEGSTTAVTEEAGPFGPILHGFEGNWQEAALELERRQTGDAIGALNHPDVGPIDLVWGNAGTNASNGAGLAKLLAWHPEVLGDLQGFINRLHVDKDRSTTRRIQLRDDLGNAGIRLDYDGTAKTWLLTAFENGSRRTERSSRRLSDLWGDQATPTPPRAEEDIAPQSSEVQSPKAPTRPPETVYHGTSSGGFDAFDTYGGKYGLFGSGGYFTEDPAIAREYTRKGRGATPTVYAASIKVKNPLDMDAPADLAAWEKAFREYFDARSVPAGSTNERAYREVEENLANEMIPDYEGAETMQDGVRSMGHDAITHIGGGRHKASKGTMHRVWIVFDPEQVQDLRPANDEIGFAEPEKHAGAGHADQRRPDPKVKGTRNDLKEMVPPTRAEGIRLNDWARESVVGAGKQKGHEYLMAVDADGTVVSYGTAGDPRYTGMNDKLLSAMSNPDRRLVMFHNHPRNGPLSAPDIGLLAMPGVHSVWAFGHSGSSVRASLTPAARTRMMEIEPGTSARQLQSALEAAAMSPKEVVRAAERGRRIDPEEADIAARNIPSLLAARAGIIDLKSDAAYDPAEIKGLNEAIDRAALGLAKEYSDGGKTSGRVPRVRGPADGMGSTRTVERMGADREQVGGRSGADGLSEAGARDDQAERRLWEEINQDFAPTTATTENIVTRVKDAISGKFHDAQPGLLATVPLNYFPEIAGERIPAISNYLLVKRKMDAYRGKKHDEAAALADRWRKYVSLGFRRGYGVGAAVVDKSRAAQLGDLMHEATLAGIDPSITTEEERGKPGYDRMRKKFTELPPIGRQLFQDVRDAYREQADELDQLLLDNVRKAQELAAQHAERSYREELADIAASAIDPAARRMAEENAASKYKAERTKGQWASKARMTRLRQQFESNRVAPPYFPLSRFGDYYVTARRPIRDADGNVTGSDVLHFSRHETKADANRVLKDVASELNGAEITTGRMPKNGEIRKVMDPRVVGDIEKLLADSGVGDDVRDALYQRWLTTFPDLSMRKRFIHRKGISGFNKDAFRAFGSAMFHGAHQMGRLKYGLELQENVNRAEEQAKEFSDNTREMALVNELNLRDKWVRNPGGNAFVNYANSAAFIWYMGFSPAAAIVNASQTWMMGVPLLGAKFGIGRAAAALLTASREFAVGRGDLKKAGLSREEKAAMDAFYNSGLIDRTQSHDLAAVSETGTRYDPIRAKVMRAASWGFHNVEVFNRSVTALAAYRLARDAGQDHIDAINTAHERTYATHFDMTNSSRPRIMQRPELKFALMFRSYQVNMLYRLFRDVHQAVKGESRQIRREAVTQLAGTVGMMGLMAGATGTVGYGIAMTAAGILSGIFGDDDDPMTMEDRFKAGVIEMLGPELGGIFLYGAPGHYLGIDLTARIGMPDLWFRSPDRDLEGKEAWEYYVLNSLGAGVSMMGSMFEAYKVSTDDGSIARGIEIAAPKAVRDLMKTWRYAWDGVTTRRGDEVVAQDQISPANLISQALGFTPAKISETYDRTSALKNAEAKINDARRSAINAFAKAVEDKDPEARTAALVEIRRFNTNPAHRPVAITGDTLKRSLSTRAKNRAKREDGALIQNEALGRQLRKELPERVY